MKNEATRRAPKPPWDWFSSGQRGLHRHPGVGSGLGRAGSRTTPGLVQGRLQSTRGLFMVQGVGQQWCGEESRETLGMDQKWTRNGPMGAAVKAQGWAQKWSDGGSDRSPAIAPVMGQWGLH